MKTIFHVITSLGDGGAEGALFRLCINDTKYHHHIVSLTDRGKYGDLLAAKGVPVTCLHLSPGQVSPVALWRLSWQIRQARPHAVQTWMYHADLLGGIAARLAGVQNVCWGIRQAELTAQTTSRSTLFVAKLCGRLSRIIPRHIVLCAENARKFHVNLGYDEDRMTVIQNGYDLSLVKPDAMAGKAIRTDLGISDDASIIGFVARFHKQKNHRNLLSALSLLETKRYSLTCLLVGTGMSADNKTLSNLITEFRLEGKVRLLGRRNDIPALMSALDLHVMSSRTEGFPNVLAEAMACGTPCITTDVGDAAVIVGTTGWVVPSDNPKSLAKAISQALDELGTPAWERRRKSAQARIHEKFAIATMVEGFHEVWNL